MAIAPLDQPSQYQLANNDNVYVWKTGQPTPTKRFRVVVFDSSLNALANLIVYPVPIAGQSTTPARAYANLSRILQSAVGNDLTIAGASHSAFIANTSSHLEYNVIIKEEDINPATGAYQTLPSWYVFNEKSVWNGVQNLDVWNEFDPTDYLMTTGVGATKFLSDGPSTRAIKSNQSAHLYLIASQSNAPRRYQLITYDGYDGTGSVVNNTTVSNSNASAIDSSYEHRYIRIPVGTYDIPRTDASLFSSGSPSTILNGAKSYQIKLQDNIGLGQVISETITYNIDEECSKYEGVRLHWLNRLGGYDCMNFNFKSTERTDVRRKNYRQQHHVWNGFSWAYDTMSRGKTEYDIQNSKRITVNTGYLTDSESVWMESLFTSPSVYEERSNALYALNIDGRSIIKKTSLNDKLSQYTFELEYSLLNYRQRG